jgi:hypothetical protein
MFEYVVLMKYQQMLYAVRQSCFCTTGTTLFTLGTCRVNFMKYLTAPVIKTTLPNDHLNLGYHLSKDERTTTLKNAAF